MRTLRLSLLFITLGIMGVAFLVYQFIVSRDTVLVPAEGGTYVEGVVGAPKQINPLLCQLNEADRDLCSLVFSGLTRLNESGEAVPDLAETWSISPDGITYTFKLRRDARWEDGAPVTADDVLFTINLIKQPDFPGRKDISELWRQVEATKLDDYTVQFRLNQPYAPFIDYTTIGLLPKHALEGTTAANLDKLPFNQQPKGNGPWRVAELNTSGGRISSITLEPSPTYFGARPKLGRFVLRYYPNSGSLLDAFRNGDVDGMADFSSTAETSAASELPNTTTYSMPSARFVALMINLRKDSGALALTELPVRQALLLALDREAIIRDVLKGRGILAHTPFIPGTWAHDADVRTSGRDLERAKQLLREAGYEVSIVAPSNVEVWQKGGEPIAFTLLTPESGIYPQVAEAVAQQWRELGVQVTVIPVRNIVRNFLATHQFQVALAETLLDGDPDPFPLWHRSQASAGQNFTGWENAEASQWLEQARTTTDRALRVELYRRFQQKFVEELPAIMLYYPAFDYVISSRVRNVQVAPIVYPSDRFRSLSEWMINLRRVPASEVIPQP
ncbi:MAG: peptide ABC transporter substrate-binding protein [Thermoflexales bacterium]|nr:peptide ABC transporter substrate-binding protein [Thermoflexales bacterium]MDW8350637.1 peptide ABC transporter substrate-binding protein [Anaerolineae bacterium]